MTDINPLFKIIERVTNMARLHGTAFCRVTWDAEKEIFNFSPILPEHVIVTYDEVKHD